MKPIKCVVVGDGAVGKTCLLISYTSNAFPGEYIITVFDNYVTNLIVDNTMVNLQLWDTAGQENLVFYRKLAYPQTDVFIICFSLVNRNSYDNVIHQWKAEIENNTTGVPIVLVGTKSDLRDDYISSNSGNEIITTEEGKNLQKQIGAQRYIECSAKTTKNMAEVFEETCRIVINKDQNEILEKADVSCSGCLLL